MKLKIKKGDTVQVIAGADKGKKGSVLQLDRIKLRILVQGVRMQTNYDKEKGMILKEGFVDYSNVKLVTVAKAPAKKKTKAKAKSK